MFSVPIIFYCEVFDTIDKPFDTSHLLAIDSKFASVTNLFQLGDTLHLKVTFASDLTFLVEDISLKEIWAHQELVQ